VAVVTVNDATSNAVGVLSLSLSLSLPSSRLPALVIAASFRSSAVSRPRTRFIESTIVWGLYRVSAARTATTLGNPRTVASRREISSRRFIKT